MKRQHMAACEYIKFKLTILHRKNQCEE